MIIADRVVLLAEEIYARMMTAPARAAGDRQMASEALRYARTFYLVLEEENTNER